MIEQNPPLALLVGVVETLRCDSLMSLSVTAPLPGQILDPLDDGREIFRQYLVQVCLFAGYSAESS